MLLSSAPIVHHPLLIELGPITVSGFGIAVMLGFVIGQIVSQRELARRGHDASPMGDVVLGAVLGFLVGAKLYYVMLNGFDLSLVFTRGGFVFWGGFAGGIVGAWLVIRYKKVPFLRIADVAAPAIAAGYAVGRTGCWAVGDDYGRPWNGPFAVAFPEGAPPSTAGIMAREFGAHFPAGTDPNTVISVYPTQLFEVAMGLVMFAWLWRLRDHRHAEGWLFGVYCVLAGVERFIVEFFRAKDDRFLGPFTTAQAVALVMVVVGALVMQWRRAPGAGKPGIYPVAAG